MSKPIRRALISTAVIFLATLSIASAEDVRFNGADSSRLPAFTVDGPWTLDWTAWTEHPKLASIEIRLYEADSGDFVGMIAELKGVGRGYKLFEQSGSFKLVIVGSSISWDILIKEVSAEQAASLKRSADGKPSLLDTAKRVGNRVPQDSFESWRAESDALLLLFDGPRIRWRVSFASSGCPGLEQATSLSFVTPVNEIDTGYESILLDDGTRCYFQRVTPDLLQ